MTETDTKRSTTGFKTLNEFLDEEGIRDEVTKNAQEKVAYQRLLDSFMEARSTEAPFGWDMNKLTELRTAISEHIRNHQVVTSFTSDVDLKTKTFIYQILNRGFERKGGTNITAMNEIHDNVTAWLREMAAQD